MQITINMDGALTSEELEEIFLNILKNIPDESRACTYTDIIQNSEYQEIGQIWVYTDEWNGVKEKKLCDTHK